MTRPIRSEAELARILARPGYAVREQFGGEQVNTDLRDTAMAAAQPSKLSVAGSIPASRSTSTPGAAALSLAAGSPAHAPGTLTLPWPPSGQHSHGHHGSRRYLLPEVLAYRDAVANLAHGHARTRGPYRLFVHLSPPDRRRRDADNAIKAVLDALVKAAYIEDDAISFMRELHVTTDADRYGWVKVRVEPAA